MESEKNDLKQSLQNEWLQMWSEFGKQFAELPDWAQKFLIRDMREAFRARLALIKQVETQPIYAKDFNQPPNGKSMQRHKETRKEP